MQCVSVYMKGNGDKTLIVLPKYKILVFTLWIHICYKEIWVGNLLCIYYLEGIYVVTVIME